LLFVLTQKEGKILYDIQQKLEIGTVKQFNNESGSISHRLIVSDTQNILMLAILFNNNFVLYKRLNQLSLWIDSLQSRNIWKYGAKQIKPKKLTLDNAWFSGLVDAEFNVNITKRSESLNGHRIRLRFIVDQKDAKKELSYIKALLNTGHISLRTQTDSVYRYTIDSFIGAEKVIGYFVKYPLQTKKYSSFMNWYKIYQKIKLKQHLSTDGLIIIRKIKDKINTINALFEDTNIDND
jgi:LAGLIDADG endonuclease